MRPDALEPDKVTDVDVLVAGGGMAGVFAALGAREGGASVLLVEPHAVLGGQGTAGGVAGFCGDTQRVNRSFAALVARLEGVREVQTYGLMLHAFVDDAARRRPEIEAALHSQGITCQGMREIETRMEDAFISLIRRREAER